MMELTTQRINRIKNSVTKLKLPEFRLNDYKHLALIMMPK